MGLRIVVALALTCILVPAARAAGSNRLVDAAANADVAAVRQLLAAGAVVDAADADGATPLHWAVWADDPPTVEALLAAGARATATNAFGVAPISIAAANGSARILERLLDAGARVDTVDAAGDTALMAAVRSGNPDAVRLLLDRGAPAGNAEPQLGHTALMWAARTDNGPIVRLLLERGAPIDARTRVGTRPAVRPPGAGGGSHGVGIVRGGVPPQGEQQPTPGGMTALLFAARDGSLEATRALLDAGADLNAADANGMTPLLMAITNAQFPVAQMLVERGADVQAADWYGRTPLWAAVEARNLDLRSGATDNGVDRAAAMRLIEAIAAKGVDVDARVKEFPPQRRHMLPLGSLEWVDFTGQTAFIRAAQSADVPVMRLLLSKGADPSITTFNGTSALMAAAGVNWVAGQTYSESPARWLEAVRLCLELGLDVNAVNEMGLAAVHGAANRGSDDIIELLARHGARLDVPDAQGRTPYVWAEGVFLATNSPVAKPSTMALLQRLTAASGRPLSPDTGR